MPELTADTASASAGNEVEARQRAYYDRIAETYHQHYHHPHALAYRHRIYERILADLPIGGMHVLDAMCGGGENTAYFLKRGATVEGCDLSQQQCNIYARNYPSCPVRCVSILQTGYADATFDLVAVDSLHHLHPRVHHGVDEILRILKPGGHLLLWEPAAGSLLDLLRKAWYRLDPTYFQRNEKAIDLRAIQRGYAARLEPVRQRYGGNVGYLLVFASMAFRIPPRLVGWYAPLAMAVERVLSPMQGRLMSCWVLGLLRKPPTNRDRKGAETAVCGTGFQPVPRDEPRP